MAEITTAITRKNKVSRKKLSTRVDLTPMVDLGFLLITFFIITTSWSDPKGLKLVLPADGDESNVSEEFVLTVIPMQSGVFYFDGKMEEAYVNNNSGIAGYALINGIGNVIRKKQQIIEQVKPGSKNELMLLIKPSSNSSYKNFVSILNEVLINDIKRYAIMDIDSAEENWAISSFK